MLTLFVFDYSSNIAAVPTPNNNNNVINQFTNNFPNAV